MSEAIIQTRAANDDTIARITPSNDVHPLDYNNPEELGAYLRKLRQAENIRVDEVALKINITPDAVEAIEQGDLKRLPAPVFAKGYTLTYATYLVKDTDQLEKISNALQARVNNAEFNDDISTAMVPSYDTRSIAAKFNEFFSANTQHFLVGLVIIVLLLVVGGVWYSWTTQKRTGTNFTEEVVNGSKTVAVSGIPNHTPTVSEGVLLAPGIDENGDPSRYESKSFASPTDASKDQDGVERADIPIASDLGSPSSVSDASIATLLTINLVGESWIEIQNDAGEVIFQGLRTTDDEVALPISTNVTLVVGNSDVVDVKLNDRVIELDRNPNSMVSRTLITL